MATGWDWVKTLEDKGADIPLLWRDKTASSMTPRGFTGLGGFWRWRCWR